VSWYEPKPAESLALIHDSGVSRDDPVIDVGAGASLLVDELLEAGFRDLTVLDVSAAALARLRERLGTRGQSVSFLESEVTAFHPARQYALWHDRAVFHFLVDADERRKYAQALRAALRPGGHAVIATFGPSGPQRCSGLPTARYDADRLSAEFGGALELVHSRLVLHHTPWHAEQQFLYCLFRKA
jgi:SAM-dependent methyltransferase